MRLEIIGEASLYLGDARELLPMMDGWADVLCSDAPYMITSGGKTGHMKGSRGGWMSDYDNSGRLVAGADMPFAEWLPAAYGALKDPAHAYLFINDRNLAEYQGAAEAAGFRFHRLLVWDKRQAFPNRWYQQTCEFVLFMRKGAAFTIANPSSRALVSMAQVDESLHPTEKPVELCRHYIGNSSAPGGVVLDPFMGSGTTGVAAIQSGRKFVGIEIDERWFEVACKRIAAAQHAPTLFEGC